jgi:hypothetical protein
MPVGTSFDSPIRLRCSKEYTARIAEIDEGRTTMGSSAGLPGLVALNLNVDLDKLLHATWQKFLKLLGKDAESQDLKKWLEERMRIAFLQARDVQCIGMHKPVLITDIYQPTRLVRERPQTVISARDDYPGGGKRGKAREWEAAEPEIIPAQRFLLQRQSSVVRAGPGWGKTTFLHWVFLNFLLRESTDVLPILITLRRQDAINDLELIVSKLQNIKDRSQYGRVILLVDGYDEIPSEARKQVSELLLKFSVQNAGEYYLTCRDYYEIYDLKVPHLRIDEFTIDDQVQFVRAFLRAYGSLIDAEQIVLDLHTRGFSDLVRHPLLLTLAAIVRSSSSDIQVRNVVSLINAALNTLALRWDQGKGITREATTPLDGTARLKCLKRLAYTLELEPVQEHRVVNIVRKQLELMRWENVEPLEVLLEIARFYGIFVPVAERWGFVHRSLQDFLGAQYWVETGEFAEALSRGELPFDSRTAFAGCLMDDGTKVMELALQKKEGLPIFVEMLMNDASFRHDRIVRAIVDFYGRYKGEHYYFRGDDKVECALDEQFISDASSKFLDYIVQTCAPTRSKTEDTLAAYAIHELHRRRVRLSAAAYQACKRGYPERFVLDVRNKGYLRLIDVAHA